MKLKQFSPFNTTTIGTTLLLISGNCVSLPSILVSATSINCPTNAAPQLPKLDYTVKELQTQYPKLIAEYRSVYDSVGAIQPNNATFSNTIVPLANYDNVDPDRWMICPLFNKVHPDKNIRDACADIMDQMDKIINESYGRDDVYKVVSGFANNKELVDELSDSERRLVSRIEDRFLRNGMNFPANKRKELADITDQISRSDDQFSKCVYGFVGEALFTKGELAGLPESFFDGREMRKDKDNVTKYVVTTNATDIPAVMINARNWKTRLELQTVKDTGCEGNIVLLGKILKLRQQQAQLLGYKTFADLITSRNMVKNPANVMSFEYNMRNSLSPLAAKSLKEIKALKAEDMKKSSQSFDGTIYRSDLDYYKNIIIKQQNFNVSDQEVSQYFTLDNVIKGTFDIYQNLFGLKFVKIPNPLSIWHPDVTAYEVWDSKTTKFMGHFLMDIYARDGKYSKIPTVRTHISYQMTNGTPVYPVTTLLASFSKPSKTSPPTTLLTHPDVRYFFSSLGHILYDMCSKPKYRYEEPANIEQDFYKAPMLMFESWMYEPSILQKFAFHYKSGKPIPTDLIEKIKGTNDIVSVWQQMFRIVQGIFDMSIHNNTQNLDGLDATTTRLFSRVYKEIMMGVELGTKETWPQATYIDLVVGGEGQIYTELSAPVLAADFYSKFKEMHGEGGGLDNSKVGGRFREIIFKPGSSVDPNISARQFLGRQPENKAFINSFNL
ncbi:metalloendopeptidase [Mycoemilia scoparia]|uniref:Metalloendopeptidase n=1 Tax=Mycoemilia scoparia TaxID=417184 RepID=A0A9W7ZT75_9FUNG|nr:metalloendopeptidase [Mycoemilia scoparia]